MHKILAPLLAVALGALSTPALAHTGHGAGFALSDGFLHPLQGADHLLAMLAVGLWAAQIGGRALWALPLTFVVAMTCGALAATVGLAPGGVEATIIASVVVLGAAIAARAQLPLAVSMAVCALFALAHGQAHGLELSVGASIAAYSAGFIAATALLHIGGVLLGRWTRGVSLFDRMIGVVISAAGIAMAAA